MKCDMKVEHEDGELKTHDWNYEIKVDTKIDAYHNKLIEMRNEFEYIWAGHLGCISVANHVIDTKIRQNATPYTLHRTGRGQGYVRQKTGN